MSNILSFYTFFVLIILFLVLLKTIECKILLVDGSLAHNNSTNGICGFGDREPCSNIDIALKYAENGDELHVYNTAIYTCPDHGQGIMVDKEVEILGFSHNNHNHNNSLYDTDLTIIDCQGLGRAFWFNNVSVNINGFMFVNGYANDTTLGGSAVLFTSNYNFSESSSYSYSSSSSSFNHIWANNIVQQNQNIVDSALSFYYFGNTQNNSHFVINSSFLYNNGTTGAIMITYNGVSNENNRHVFKNSLFSYNYATFALSFFNAGSGAVAILYQGAALVSKIHNNHHEFSNCTFEGNVLFVDILKRCAFCEDLYIFFSGAVIIVSFNSMLGSDHGNDNNTYLFQDTQFISNNLFSNSPHDSLSRLGGSVAGALLITSTSIYENNINTNSRYEFSRCSFVSNSDGSNNFHQLLTLDGSSSGAITISSHAKLFNTLINNTYSFANCIFDANQGGSLATGINAISGSAAVDLSSFSFSSSGISNYNVYSFIQCTFMYSQGGNSNGDVSTRSTFSSGALSILFFSLHQNNVEFDQFYFVSTVFHHNSGGNNGAQAVAENALVSVSACLNIASVGMGENNNYGHTYFFNDTSFIENTGANDVGLPVDQDVAQVSSLAIASTCITILYASISASNKAAKNNHTFYNMDFIFNNGAEGTAYHSNVNSYGLASVVAIAYISLSDKSTSTYNNHYFSDCHILSNIAGDKSHTSASAGILFINLTPHIMVTTNNIYSFESCTFESNFCRYGDGTSVDRRTNGASAINIVNSALSGLGSIENNSYLINKCFFIQNRIVNTGTLYGTSATVVFEQESIESISMNSYLVSDCIFSGNVVYVQSINTRTAGGILFILPACLYCVDLPLVIEISNCHFESNQVLGASGGAVSIYSPIFSEFIVPVSFNNISFINNSAICQNDYISCSAGALLVNYLQVMCNNCIFIQNQATYSAGAILAQSGGVVNCNNCLFRENYAEGIANEYSAESGIAVSISRSKLYLLGPVIDNNSASAESIALNGPSHVKTDKTFILNQTQLTCPIGTEVYRSSTVLGCKICSAGTYNIEVGSWIDDHPYYAYCFRCPFGGNCTRGGSSISSNKGFWGFNDPNISPHVVFTYCPVQYCCENDICFGYNDCQGYRTGILCGECKPGYTEAIGSNSCISVDECNSLSWFLSLCILLGLVISLYLLFSSVGSGLVNIVSYYFQVSGLILSQQTTDGVNSTYVAIFTDFFNLQPNVGGYGVCISKTLSVVDKQVFYLLSPIFIIGPLLLLIGLSQFDKINIFITKKGLEAKPWTGFIRFSMFAYSAFVMRSLNLLHCISINGMLYNDVRLFRGAYIECYQPWQHFLFVILSFLCLLPLVLFWILWRHQKNNERDQSEQHDYVRLDSSDRNNKQSCFKRICGTERLSVSQRLSTVLAHPYNSERRYWEAVLLAFRLYAVIITVFITDPTPCLLLLFVGCAFMLILQLYFQPFKDRGAQLLQTISLGLLVLICWLEHVSAALNSNASNAQGPMKHTIEICTLFQSILFPLPCVLMLIYALKIGIASMVQRVRQRFDSNILESNQRILRMDSLDAVN